MKKGNKKSRKWQTPGSSWFKYLKMDTPKLNRNNRTSKRNSPEIAESDKTANSLTRCIIDWLKFNNHQMV
jgi:hypothetical protein